MERKIELIGPDDEARIAQKTPELSWFSIGDAASYEVQLSKTEDFADPVTGTAAEMKYEIPDPLTIGDDRYWRVRAVGTDETEGPWSDVRSFEIVPSKLPKLVNTLDLGANAWGLDVSGNYLYSSAGSNGIKVFDISSPADPELVDTVPTSNGNGVWDIFVSGDYAYASEGGANTVNPYYVYLLDISDPANVIEKHSYPAANQLYGLLYMGVSLYVGHLEGYYRFDSSPPNLGSPTADIDPSGANKRVNSFDHYGSFLVYTVDDEGIRILNLNGNTEVGSAAAADTAKFDNSMVTVYGHYAYVTSMNSDYIEIFDIEDVTNPVSTATYPLSGGGNNITIADHFAFVSIFDGSVRILDITDPLSPTEWGAIPPEEAVISWNAVSGNYLYGTDYSNGKLKVIDLVPEAE